MTRKKSLIISIIALVLVSVMAVALVFTIGKVDKMETTKTISSNVFTYSIGTLDEEGKYKQGTSSIYLKDFQEVDGLICDIKEDATITYKVVFYDSEKEFISATEELSADFDGSSIPESAKYFKVMITPTNDAEVSFFEIDTYADQLTVKVNK